MSARGHPVQMSRPVDDDLFKRMFAKFIARDRSRGHPPADRSRAPPPARHDSHPNDLRRTHSDHHGSRSKRGTGLFSALVHQASGRSSAPRSPHSSGSPGASAHSYYPHQYQNVDAQYTPPAQRAAYDPQQQYSSAAKQPKASSRSPSPFSPAPAPSGSPGAGPSRKYNTKSSEKTVSTEDGRRPRKRSRTIVRSQSAHAGSLHSSSRKTDKSKPRVESQRSRPGVNLANATPSPPVRSPPVRSFQCNMCESVFAQRGQLSRHIRRVHEKLRPHACEHCGRLFGARSDRTRHIQIVHKKIRDHACQICGFKFQAKTHLEAHVRTVHHGDRPYTCELCGFSFGLRSNLLTHERTVHFKEAKWRCTVCDKAFNRKHDQRRHMKLVHDIDSPGPSGA